MIAYIECVMYNAFHLINWTNSIPFLKIKLYTKGCSAINSTVVQRNLIRIYLNHHAAALSLCVYSLEMSQESRDQCDL